MKNHCPQQKKIRTEWRGRRFWYGLLLGLAIVEGSLLLESMLPGPPPINPATFGLPATAKELSKRRTARTATFDLGDGRYADVSFGAGTLSTCDSATGTC